MKYSTTNVETSNVKIPSNEEEVFHESPESFQEESFSSFLNNDVQQSSEEVRIPSLNTQSVSNNMVPNVDRANTSHNVFNEHLEDAYFDASTLFHDSSNVHTFYQPYLHEKKWTKDHPLHKIIGDLNLSVHTRATQAYKTFSRVNNKRVKKEEKGISRQFTSWVVDMDRLIGNLCTLWVGRFHLHAKVVRYERSIKSSTSKRVTAEKPPSSFNHRPSEESPSPSFARKRLCIMTSVADNILETFKVIFKGKVYSIRAKELFTWTHCFLEFKESGYNSEDDSFLGNVNNIDTPQHDKANSTGESDDEGVSDTIFGDNLQSPCQDRHDENVQETTQHSEYPFGLYKLLKKPINNPVVEDATSLSHPPGFTPQVSQQETQNADSDHQQEIQAEPHIEKGASPKVSVSANGFTQEHFVNDSPCEATTQVQSRFTHNGGSILEVLDDMIKAARMILSLSLVYKELSVVFNEDFLPNV
nr:hypothetical protein [Tanacetum cinerariifolium]